MRSCFQRLLLPVLLAVGLSGCGASYDAQTVEETMTQDDRLTPVSSDPTVEKCNGQCCHVKCGGGWHSKHRNVGCGECRTAALAVCAYIGEPYRNHFWGGCPD